jgi:predicted AlkP superfamily phosphohydrolase/phosphomutase
MSSSAPRLALSPITCGLLLSLFLALGACSDGSSSDAGPEWLVIGIDGADWGVINALWEEGKLPHLKALADRGVAGGLRTSYGASPVIWTSVATGVVPEVHGITGFAVPTPDGDVPVSSRVRKVPALWNMLTTAGRRTAVVSWWASWPAERIDGVVVSDRAGLKVANAVSPPELEPRFVEWSRLAEAEDNLFDSRLSTVRRDHETQFVARRLLDVEFDLVMVYFRGVDIASHKYWKYHEPERFPDVDPAELEELGAIVSSTYEATDAAIGRLVAKVGGRTNVMVLSDHGFHAMKSEEVRIMLDFDQVLTRLGFQHRAGGKIDWDRTELYTFATAKFRLNKRIRFAPDIAEADQPGLRERLTAELAKFTYSGGEPVFSVRGPGDRERRTGAHFIVEVSRQGVTTDLHYGDEVWERAVPEISFLSGTHTERTHGILFAAGPDVDPAATVDGIHIHDITPTLLYGLGLPVAEDFAGRAFVELYGEDYRRSRPLRSIPTWGLMGEGEALASAADEEILDDLRALGYID